MRGKGIRIRLSEEELLQLKKLATKNGLTVSEYMRLLALNNGGENNMDNNKTNMVTEIVTMFQETMATNGATQMELYLFNDIMEKYIIKKKGVLNGI